MDPNQLSPEQLQQYQQLVEAMTSLSTEQDQQGLLGKEMGIGQQRAQIQQPEGTQAGRFYVAASPLAHMAAALQQYMGMKQMKDAQQGMRDSFGRQKGFRTDYGNALIGNGMFGGGIQTIPSSGTGGEF